PDYVSPALLRRSPLPFHGSKEHQKSPPVQSAPETPWRFQHWRLRARLHSTSRTREPAVEEWLVPGSPVGMLSPPASSALPGRQPAHSSAAWGSYKAGHSKALWFARAN